MPISGTVRPYLATVLPTSFITPVSIPPVRIHACADVAAAARPSSKAWWSVGGSLKSSRPPQTEISSFGSDRPQYSLTKTASRAGEVLFETEIHGACS
eukprot:6020942-Prymnesium_polylepis.1